VTPVPGKSKRGNKFVHREAQAAVLRLSIWHKTWPTVPLQAITRKASPYGKLHRESCIYQTKEQEQCDFASEAVDWTHVDPYDGTKSYRNRPSCGRSYTCTNKRVSVSSELG